MRPRWPGWRYREAGRGGMRVMTASPGWSRRNNSLEQELAKARFVVEVQGKTARALGDDLRERGARARVTAGTDAAVADLAPTIGVWAAC